MDNLVKLQHFFSVDMNIKKTLVNLRPPMEYGDDNTITKYVDSAYESLDYIYSELKCIAMDYLGEKSILFNNILDMEKYVKDSFINAGLSIEKLQKLYNEFLCNMDQDFVSKVKSGCVGYSSFDNSEAQQKACSVNEILHFLHSYIINNENVLSAIPKIDSKVNDYDYPINYRGVSCDYFKQLFINFPSNIEVGWTDMICLNNNKMIMMVRDRGHALSIEITLKDDIARVEYFIPKLCNIDMINALPGINKVDKEKASINGYGATGVFEIDKNNISSYLFDFINRVPTDRDMQNDNIFRR